MAVESPKKIEQEVNYDKISLVFDGKLTENILEYTAEKTVKRTINLREIRPYYNNLDNIVTLKNKIYLVDPNNLNGNTSGNLKTMLKTGAIQGEYIGDFVNNHPIFFKNIKEIKSGKFKRSNSGNTLCSQTARENAEMFGLKLPRGHASVSFKSTPIDNRFVRNIKNNVELNSVSDDEGVNFAGIEISSRSKFGHRAMAFKDDSNNWYVLDPYRSPFGSRDARNQQPQPLEEYTKRNKIKQANLYLAPIQASVPKVSTIPILDSKAPKFGSIEGAIAA